MVFADLFFIYFFLPLCLICYFAAKKLETRNKVLIVFSLIFYAWGEPIWIILLLFSAAFNWIMGMHIGANRNKPRGKIFIATAISVDILLLLIFKYTGFFAETFNGIFHASIPVPQIALPIGISFYTFQAISYVLDCYWENVKPQRQFSKFLLYLSLFPQLIAGPIVRYSVVEQEVSKRRVTATDLSEGALRIIVGLAKKVIIANNLYAIVTQFFGQDISTLSTLGTWYTVIVYSMYVYFDFSGYSDMAIGLGRMFGFHFDENFKYPFACKTIAEFWQRWHISLGSFFRDYLLYVPIFGKNRKYFSLFLVWFCTGLWHGASWKYVMYGLYYWAIMVIGLLMEPLFKKLYGKMNVDRQGKVYRLLQVVRTFIFVNVGMLMFRADDLTAFGHMFVSMFRGFTFADLTNGTLLGMKLDMADFVVLTVGALILFLVGLCKEKGHQIRAELATKNIALRWAVYYVLLFGVIILGAYGKGYEVAGFIYAQF